ncbi:unnamed protein product [Phytophthora fragariaefolia]|uniref:Unnamed protein product n=1 Tax=Phytophthora fragariaefolia TaxID=1490495 RepID=A0A9W7D285_9STRA|nr:unnamed protein product [Phytophthora fragariaefolia]
MAGSGRLDAYFYCDVCVLKTPLCYWDFLAAHVQHVQLLTENFFKLIGIVRVPLSPKLVTTPVSTRSVSRRTESEVRLSQTSQHQTEESSTKENIINNSEEDWSPWPSVMLFNRNMSLVAVGDKCFRIPASSRDPEMYIVIIRYVLTRAYPATQQGLRSNKDDTHNSMDMAVLNKWEVSYARQGALDIPLSPGNAMFWAGSLTRDVLALEYTRRTVDDLEQAFMYEFQGEHSTDNTFAIGGMVTKADPVPSSPSSNSSTVEGLWMDLTPRKGICVKLLAAQLGQLKKVKDVHILHSKKNDNRKGPRKPRKPHFPGQQLNKIAVDTTI